MKYNIKKLTTIVDQIVRIWHDHESVRFMIVGVYNALFGLVVFAILHQALHKYLHYLAILPIAHILAVANAFIGHRVWTYRVKGHLLIDFFRFNLSYLGLLALGMLAMPLFVSGMGIHPILASALTLGATTLISFFVHKSISFRRKKTSSR